MIIGLGFALVNYHFLGVNILTNSLRNVVFILYIPKLLTLQKQRSALTVHFSPILLQLQIQRSPLDFLEIVKMPYTLFHSSPASLVASKQSMSSANMLANLLVDILEVDFTQIRGKLK